MASKMAPRWEAATLPPRRGFGGENYYSRVHTYIHALANLVPRITIYSRVEYLEGLGHPREQSPAQLS